MTEEAIFYEAIAQAPADRAAYLDRACAGDPALRAAVEALLRANVGATGFLESPPVGSPATLDLPAVSEGPGAVIGPYKLLEQIGEGGFGVVFLAEQTRPVRRKVALKVLKAGMDTRQVVARFEAERQALALMDHPNIARVFDGGMTPSGRPYFVMELVRGVPITQFCDDQRLPPAERLKLFADVCRAVQHAHTKGIIHRDLKPSNVLVASHDGQPVVKVIDFGVAKALGQELTDKTLFTGFAQMVGTPLYMSPEQAGQSSLDVDTRSDVYSLGVLLYELLTGTTPFDRDRFRQAAYDEVRRIIREEDPPRPSTRLSTSESLPSVSAQRNTEPARLTKLVRGELDWIVMKALEKDRARRYETATGLAADVDRYLAEDPVSAVPPSAAYRLRKFARRNRGPVASAALLVAALAAGVVGTTVGLVQARRAEGLANDRLAQVTDERNRATAAAAETRAVFGFLTDDLLGQADPDRNPADRQVTVAELLRRAEQRIDRNPRFADQPAAEATLHLTIAAVCVKLGMLPEAERHFQRAADIRRAVLGPDARETLAAQEAQADFLNRILRRPDLALPRAERTWRARARVLGPDDPDTVDSLDTYATALGLAGRRAEAVNLLRQCLATRTRILGAEDKLTLISLNNLANMLGELGEDRQVIPLLRELFAARKRVGPPTDLAAAAYNLAVTLHLLGELPEADTLATEYADWAARTLTAENTDADRLAGLAVRTAVDRGRIDDAIARGQAVLAHRRKAYPPGDFLIGAILVDLGRARVLNGEFTAAQRDLDEAYEILRASRVSKPYWVPWAQCWRGACLAGLKRYADAAPLLLEAEKGLRTAAGTPAYQYRTVVEQLVTLYEKWGRPAEAAGWQQKLPAGNSPAKP